jgi:F-type H+-transporting ATPase subunit alpha
VLKQPQYSPVPLHQQVMILWAAINGFLDDVPLDRVRAWEEAFHTHMERTQPDVGQAITTEKQLSDESLAKLRAAAEQFKAQMGRAVA